ncbi:MAG TPA: tRNA pseudouridine(38-40) synthase TruA [Thermoanaerobaculia bacterium]|nr:tRNA pseudouridine(38-40) synthase TruA [Thermoanaerobaculia bacterium]
MRLLLTLQYRGTRYGGWQLQANAPSVQQVVEEALVTMFSAPIRVHGAGRTDSGVHALAQRAHIDAPVEIPPRGFLLGINNLLPDDVRVIRVEQVADDFHSRFDAKGKSYAYRIWNTEFADVFHSETHAHVAQHLDETKMHEAAQALRGTHDFKAFTVAEPEVSSTIRTVENVAVTRDGNVVRIDITADGFIRYMVRRIAGSLIEIGRGKLDGDALRRSLEPAFEVARWTAVAKGLILVSIDYALPDARCPSPRDVS